MTEHRQLQIAPQFGFGLELVSDIRVPGAIGFAAAEHGPAIRIALAGQHEPGGEARFVRDGEAIVYRHPTGDYRCCADRIEVAPGEPLDIEDLGVLLVANALPALLWQRGAFMLHAASVRLPEGLTIAIAGPSGAGKSRLAAGFVEAGAELIGDDSLALNATGEGVLASGLAGGWFSRGKDSPVREFVRAPGGQSGGTARLDLLAVLGDARPMSAPLSRLAALECLMQNRHRPQVPALLDLQGQVLSHAVKIAHRLPIVRLGACPGSDRDLAAMQSALGGLAREACYGSRTVHSVTGA